MSSPGTTRPIITQDRLIGRMSDVEFTAWHRAAARFLASCVGTGAVLGAAVAAARGPHD